MTQIDQPRASAASDTVATRASERQVPEKPPGDVDGGYFAQAYATSVDEVVPQVLVERGFHLCNVIQVSTPEGAVIIDTTGGTRFAARARDAIAARNRQDPLYIVYTHCHNDHVRGADALVTDATREIVSHELLPVLQDRDMGRLGNFVYGVLKSHQLGSPIEAGGRYFGGEDPFIKPSLTFRNSFDLEVGGLQLHLEHTEGETRDHLLVWIPTLSVLCCGDIFYATFPNLSSPGVGPRPITGWIRSLDRFIQLGPEHLVPSHGPPISGREAVRTVLTNYRDAIQHVYDESIRLMDLGVPVDAAARQVQLPEHLVHLAYLEQLYGTVNIGVRAVYANLTGWYNGDPASLDPLPRDRLDHELLDAAGGAAEIVGRARSAVARGDEQLALELVAIVLSQAPGHREANEVKAAACRALIDSSVSTVAKNFYLSGALIAEHQLAPS